MKFRRGEKGSNSMQNCMGQVTKSYMRRKTNHFHNTSSPTPELLQLPRLESTKYVTDVLSIFYKIDLHMVPDCCTTRVDPKTSCSLFSFSLYIQNDKVVQSAYYRRSKRGGCSDGDLTWLDRDAATTPLPLPLPLPTEVDGGGASLGAVCSFLLEAKMDPISVAFFSV